MSSVEGEFERSRNEVNQVSHEEHSGQRMGPWKVLNTAHRVFDKQQHSRWVKWIELR
jgi:hypothetical protein